MKFSDAFFKKIEDKTKVNKETILSLADKLKQGDLKDEKVLRDMVQEISALTGKTVSKDKEDKIVNSIKNDNVQDNLDSFLQ